MYAILIKYLTKDKSFDHGIKMYIAKPNVSSNYSSMADQSETMVTNPYN